MIKRTRATPDDDKSGKEREREREKGNKVEFMAIQDNSSLTDWPALCHQATSSSSLLSAKKMITVDKKVETKCHQVENKLRKLRDSTATLTCERPREREREENKWQSIAYISSENLFFN